MAPAPRPDSDGGPYGPTATSSMSNLFVFENSNQCVHPELPNGFAFMATAPAHFCKPWNNWWPPIRWMIGLPRNLADMRSRSPRRPTPADCHPPFSPRTLCLPAWTIASPGDTNLESPSHQPIRVPQACQALVERGVDPNLALRADDNSTPLFLAAEAGSTSLCKRLLKCGACPVAADASAAAAAASAGHIMTAHFLATQTVQPVPDKARKDHRIPAVAPLPRMHPAPMQSAMGTQLALSFMSPVVPLGPLCLAPHWLLGILMAVAVAAVVGLAMKRRLVHFYAFWWGSVALVLGVWAVVVVPCDLQGAGLGPVRRQTWYTMPPGSAEAVVRRQVWFVIAMVWLAVLFWAMRRDPGCLPVDADRATMLELAAGGWDIRPDTYCYLCMSRRPYRSRHSRVEDRCVARFDHHCLWLGLTVGAGNQVCCSAGWGCPCAPCRAVRKDPDNRPPHTVPCTPFSLALYWVTLTAMMSWVRVLMPATRRGIRGEV